MRWSIPTKRKGNIELEVSNFTQLTGTNKQLIFDIMQVVKWYFCGRKYTEEDLSLFFQNELIIEREIGTVKRDSFKVICLDTMESISNQLGFKKSSISFEYLKYVMRKTSFEGHLELLNNELLSLVQQIDKDSAIYMEESSFHVAIKEILSENIIQKFLNPVFAWSDMEVAFEWLDNFEKMFLILKMLEYILMNSDEDYLLILEGMDQYLTGDQYQKILKKLNQISEQYHLTVVNEVFDGEYLWMEDKTLPSINIISDYINHFHDLEFMKERFMNEYPTNIEMEDKEMLEVLRNVSQFIFTENLERKSISEFDLIATAIINKLYLLEISPKISYRECLETEKNFQKKCYFNVKNNGKIEV
ncbi:MULTISPECIES: CRISPR-associated protein Csn2-St [Terrabacteria group]|uniref:CRISPR-associated protein Csn2-St n=1 Tax=Bacillati TaxID=1783272 RepID=UPI001C6E371D|nr:MULTISPECIES: CRISPR-associated protein Csn2-St [Terrabacteria group]MBW9212634.1 hypothetical protein [Trueperella sp. zg.1013]